MDKEGKVMENLKIVKRILGKYNIDFWLEDGTLLGAMREGRFLPWDLDDTDLGTFKKHFENKKVKKALSRDFEKEGFSVYFFEYYLHLYKGPFNIDLNIAKISDRHRTWTQFRPETPMAKIIIKIRKIQTLEYYGKFKFNSNAGSRDLIKSNFLKLVHYTPKIIRRSFYRFIKFFLSPFVKISYPYLKISDKYFKNLKTIKFYGEDFKIPDYINEYLTKRYGDWKKPPKKTENWKDVWFTYGKWKKLSCPPKGCE